MARPTVPSSSVCTSQRHLILSTTRYCWRDLSPNLESMAFHSLGCNLTFLIKSSMWNLVTIPPLQLNFLLVFLRALSWDPCISQLTLHPYPASFMASKYLSINMQMTQVSSLSSPAIACPINSEICRSAQMQPMISILLTFFDWIRRNPKSCFFKHHLKTHLFRTPTWS